MAGLTTGAPAPMNVTVHGQSRVLEVEFSDGARFRIPFELMRVYSPSAQVQGHGPGQETLQTGKRNVDIERIEPVGTYALRLVFSDGHDSGLYSWDLLYNLGKHHEELWQNYLAQIEAQGLSRDVDTTSRPAAGGGCGHHH